jgi:hypothetical protein
MHPRGAIVALLPTVDDYKALTLQPQVGRRGSPQDRTCCKKITKESCQFVQILPNKLGGWGSWGMSSNFHENYLGGETLAPSERSTGLVFAAMAVIVALLWRNSPMGLWPALGIAAVLGAISLIAPILLKPLNILWFKFGLLLHRLVGPIVMLLIFTLVFVPSGMIVRIWLDPLRSRRITAAMSYWIDHREEGGTAGSMTNQF